MKRNDAGGFCILYVEPGDDRDKLLRTIIGQQKHIVLMLAEQAQLFQRSQEFIALKHIKRQLGCSQRGMGSGTSGVPACPDASFGRTSARSHSNIVSYTQGNGASKAARARYCRHANPSDSGGATVSIVAAIEGSAASYARTIVVCHAKVTVAASKRTSADASVRVSTAATVPAVLIALMILALSAAGLASLLVFYHVPATSGASAPVVVGHVYFLSSGQMNENTNQGIDDEVQIDLHGLTNPAPGKKYYAWLLGDKSQGETQAILLGILQVHKGAVQTFYGDQAHTNLLAITSRFLVTEEDGAVMPVTPSLDYNTWHYYGQFLQTSVQSSSSTTPDDAHTDLSRRPVICLGRHPVQYVSEPQIICLGRHVTQYVSEPQ